MTPDNVEARRDVELVITKLDDGQLRVAEIGRAGCRYRPRVGETGNLAALSIARLEKTEVGPFEYLDKLELKRDYERRGVRVVPARRPAPAASSAPA